MKSLLISAATIAMSLGLHMNGWAQTTSSDTTQIQLGKRLIVITPDSSSGSDRVTISKQAGAPKDAKENKSESDAVHVGALKLDIGFNMPLYDGSLNLPTNLSLFETKPLNSSNLGLHVLPTTFSLAKHHVNIGTAVTFDFNDFAFSQNVVIVPNLDTVALVLDTVNDYQKSKLKTVHAQIPLMLNFQTNPTNKKKNFQISVGGYAGLLLGSKSKTKTEAGDKVKVRDDFNLEKFRYGVMGRIGFRNLELYASYSLSSMFREGRGPEFHPITVGISLTGPFHGKEQ